MTGGMEPFIEQKTDFNTHTGTPVKQAYCQPMHNTNMPKPLNSHELMIKWSFEVMFAPKQLSDVWTGHKPGQNKCLANGCHCQISLFLGQTKPITHGFRGIKFRELTAGIKPMVQRSVTGSQPLCHPASPEYGWTREVRDDLWVCTMNSRPKAQQQIFILLIIKHPATANINMTSTKAVQYLSRISWEQFALQWDHLPSKNCGGPTNK